MKKIIFLLLVCFIKLNAYEYLFFDNYDNSIQYSARLRWFTDSTGTLRVKQELSSGQITYGGVTYSYFNYIKIGNNHYITSNDFRNMYINDLYFLNDLYTQSTNQFFNYLYNSNNFTDMRYIVYDNYELLYDSDGLAVASIVDGVWAGLYDDTDKSTSGALYNKAGIMSYYNGEKAEPVTSFLYWLQRLSNKAILETFEEIRKSAVTGIIMAVVFTLMLVRFVFPLLFSAFSGRTSSKSTRSTSTSDFGDGAQVAASVRQRLAEKNRRLKSQSDSSGVRESLQNSIIFDLERRG